MALSIGIGLGLDNNRTGDGSASIDATVSPAAQDMFVADTVGDIANIANLRTLGNYTPTATLVEVRVNGTAQANGFALSDGDAVTVYVEDDSDPVVTRSWTIDSNVTYAAVPAFSVQPSFDLTPKIGETIAFSEGVAAPGATLTIEELTLGGVDKTGELSGLNWDTSGESAGEIRFRVRATNSAGFTLSNVITGNLAAAQITVDTQPVMGALLEGAAINTEPGTDGAYSSDYPGESLSLAIEYNVDGAGWVDGTGTAAEATSVSKRVIVTGDQGTTLTVEVASPITVGAGGDVTAPVISNVVFDGQTGTFDVSEASTLYIATYLNANGVPVVNPVGGWTSGTLEEFSALLASGSNALDFTETGASSTADRIAFYAQDAAGNQSSPMQSANYTYPSAAPDIEALLGYTPDTTLTAAGDITNPPGAITDTVMLAVDVTGLDGSAGGLIWEIGGSGNGAMLGFNTGGELIVRFGSGVATPGAETSRVVVSASPPSGSGTLIAMASGTDAVLIWQGVEQGRDSSTSYVLWGSNAGGYLQVGAGQVAAEPNVPTTPPSGTFGDLRIYSGQDYIGEFDAL